MLLFYLAYFASLLDTSDVNENPRACNRARRKKKGCDCLKRWCKDIENLISSTNYIRALFTNPNMILSLFPCIFFPISSHPGHCWSQKRPYNKHKYFETLKIESWW